MCCLQPGSAVTFTLLFDVVCIFESDAKGEIKNRKQMLKNFLASRWFLRIAIASFHVT